MHISAIQASGPLLNRLPGTGKEIQEWLTPPHGYDLLVDTKNYSEQSNFRIELIFKRMKETSEKLDVPVLVGEWGAFSGNSDAVASNTAFIIGLIEKSGFSNTYWGILSRH